MLVLSAPFLRAAVGWEGRGASFPNWNGEFRRRSLLATPLERQLTLELQEGCASMASLRYLPIVTVALAALAFAVWAASTTYATPF
jgi:hypothetical protein